MRHRIDVWFDWASTAFSWRHLYSCVHLLWPERWRCHDQAWLCSAPHNSLFNGSPHHPTGLTLLFLLSLFGAAHQTSMIETKMKRRSRLMIPIQYHNWRILCWVGVGMLSCWCSNCFINYPFIERNVGCWICRLSRHVQGLRSWSSTQVINSTWITLFCSSKWTLLKFQYAKISF